MSTYRIHANARTTPRIRQEIQNSDLSIDALAEKYNVSRATIIKWRKRKGQGVKWTPMSRPLFWKNKLSPGLVSWPSREVHCMGSLVIQRLMKALVVVKMEVVVQTLA